MHRYREQSGRCQKGVYWKKEQNRESKKVQTFNYKIIKTEIQCRAQGI